MFAPSRSKHGNRLIHGRLEKERKNYLDFCAKKREIGKLGGRPKGSKKSSPDTQTKPSDDGSALLQGMAQGSENTRDPGNQKVSNHSHSHSQNQSSSLTSSQDTETPYEPEEAAEEERAAAAAAPVHQVEVLSPAQEQIEEAFRALDRPPFGPREVQTLWASFFAMRNGHPLSHQLSQFFDEADRRGMKQKLTPVWYQLRDAIQKQEVNRSFPALETFQGREERERQEAAQRAHDAVFNSDDYANTRREPAERPVGICERCKPDGWRIINGKARKCQHTEDR
jgi:hypothetical protein